MTIDTDVYAGITAESAHPDPTPAPVAETPAPAEAKAETPQENATPEPEAKEETPETPDKPKAQKPGIAKRFSEITAEKYAALERASQAEARAQALERQLAERAAAPEPKQAPVSDDYDPFNRADVAKIIDERVSAKLQETLAEREARETANAQTKRITEFANKITEENEGALLLLNDRDGRFAVTQDMGDFIVESPVGVQLADFLGTNPAESHRIASLNPTARGVALARLEARFTAPTPEPTPKPRITNAPAPTPAVGARATAATGFRDDMTQAEFNAWRESTTLRRA
jgi:hypothetical protein